MLRVSYKRVRTQQMDPNDVNDEDVDDDQLDIVDIHTEDTHRRADTSLHASSFGGTADGDVWINKQRRDVSLSKDGLEILGAKKLVIPITEMLAVKVLPVAKLPWAYGLCIHTIKVQKSGKWEPKQHDMRFRSFEVLQRWHHRIQSLIDGDVVRPRRLRIFVNPYGGKKDAVDNFGKVLPFFELAGISLDTVVTERAGFAEQWMATANITEYDGVVAVGGDGLFNEMVNGLMRREDGARIRIGLVPSGSTDTVAYSSHGTRDALTSALHIILGDFHAMDICKVKLADGSVRYCSNFLSYGYFGDVAKESEKHRWMGPRRYDYSGFKTLMKSNSYGVKVRYIQCDERDIQPPYELINYETVSTRNDAGESISMSPSNAGMSVSHIALASIDGDAETRAVPRDQWQELEGVFKSFSLSVITCMNDKSRAGFDPLQHLSNGSISMITVKKCGRTAFLRFLIRVSNTNWNQFSLSNVSRVPVCKLSFEAVGRQSTWNLDGEVVTSPTLEAEVLPGALCLFARGPEPAGQHKPRPYPVARIPEVIIEISDPHDESATRDAEKEMADAANRKTDIVTDTHDLRSVEDKGVQTRPLPEIFSVPVTTCYSPACRAGNGPRHDTSAPCYRPFCKHATVAWPVEEVLNIEEEDMLEANETDVDQLQAADDAEMSQEAIFRRKYPDLEDPFEVIETFVSTRKLRLVDIFKNVGSRNSNMKGARKEDFARRLKELGINLNPLQFTELFLRLDRNKDNIVTYKDLVNCRKRYNLRMKAADPLWQKHSEQQSSNDVHIKDTFMVRPSPRHVYPAV
eukprot:m.129674 g.129674  ORF g.129674 m.129674 type:complete len:801 (+) comp16412_c0_seq1:16-2418(+)